MKDNKQTGYIDMQVTPAMMGAVLLFVFLGQIKNPDFDLNKNLLMFSVFLSLATVVLLYGFLMHIYALGYPESPFNKHSSPVFMTVLCAGPLIFGAWQFYSVNVLLGFFLYFALSLLVAGVAIGFALYRNK